MNYINNAWPAKIEEQYKNYLRRRNELFSNLSCLQWANMVAIPFQLCEIVVNELRKFHPEIVWRKSLAWSHFWWPSSDEMIEICVKQYKTCQANQRIPSSAPIHNWERTAKPRVWIHIGFEGRYLRRMFLIRRDTYSKRMDIHSMSDTQKSNFNWRLTFIFCNSCIAVHYCLL